MGGVWGGGWGGGIKRVAVAIERNQPPAQGFRVKLGRRKSDQRANKQGNTHCGSGTASDLNNVRATGG